MRRLIAIVIAACLMAGASSARAKTICTLLLDAPTGQVLLEQGDCEARVTPASTFKLALAVMGFDAGILEGPHAPVMAFQPGDPDWGGENWTRDTDPTDWLRFSVVWYSQRITHALGADRLNDYARALSYGNVDFSGDAGFENGLDRAWIASSLLISPKEQAAFLRGLVLDQLPVRPQAMAQTREIVETRQAGDWVLHGKTGAAYPRRADRSFDYAHGWGWYVGWAQAGATTRVFVRLTQAEERSDTSPGILARDEFLREWPVLARR